MKLSFVADKNEIRVTCLAVHNKLRDWMIPENTCQEIVLAVDEALTNILEHGYSASKQTSENIITIQLENSNNPFKVIIEDHALSYSLDAPKYEDKEAYLLSGVVGGFGLAIIKSIMDSVQLIRKENRNILEMTKKIPELPVDGSVQIITDTSEARVLNKVLMVTTKPGSVINLSQARKNVWAYEDMINQYPQNIVYAKVIDQTGLKFVSLEARKYHIHHEPEHIKAIALIRKSIFAKLLINFLTIFNKNKRAVKVFNTQAEALKWVQQFSGNLDQT